MPNVINFSTWEQQSLNPTASASGGAFTIPAAQKAPDCMIVNYGTVGAQIVFGDASVTARSTAGASGTNQVYIPAGAVMVVQKNNSTNFSAVTDTGTTSLVLHAGSGN